MQKTVIGQVKENMGCLITAPFHYCNRHFEHRVIVDRERQNLDCDQVNIIEFISVNV